MRALTGSWRHGPALLLAIGFAAPLLLLVAGALRDPTLPPPRTPELMPPGATLANFGRADALVGLARATANSLVVAGLVVPLAVVASSAAGFAISRMSGRGRGVAVAIAVGIVMMPLTALLIPRFAIFRAIGLTDTWVPLVAPALLGMSPVAVLLYYWAFRRQPEELFDAARIEGVSVVSAWWRYAMPLVRPITAAVAVLAFVTSWNNFLDPLVYLYDASSFTLPLVLKALGQLPVQQYPTMLAGALVATVPVIAVVVLAQRFIRAEPSAW
jgi:multiple sugar transport system permease protein